MTNRLAIVGTAGRGDDRDRLSLKSYERMFQGVLKTIEHLNLDRSVLQVVSGGAAWADHLAVSLVIRNIITPQQLMIYLPAHISENKFIGKNPWTEKVAGTANYYHKLFSEKTARDSLKEISHVCRQGSMYRVVDNGFKARNLKVAGYLNHDDNLLAFTFGEIHSDQPEWSLRSFSEDTNHTRAGLKDGGTAHTWDNTKCSKHHARLGFMENSRND